MVCTFVNLVPYLCPQDVAVAQHYRLRTGDLMYEFSQMGCLTCAWGPHLVEENYPAIGGSSRDQVSATGATLRDFLYRIKIHIVKRILYLIPLMLLWLSLFLPPVVFLSFVLATGSDARALPVWETHAWDHTLWPHTLCSDTSYTRRSSLSVASHSLRHSNVLWTTIGVSVHSKLLSQ